ncbi:CCR7 [Mytilus edulis]|uniref:CCR7 n=1 Tax=Mytilus edulis TaxID=6550 RepID=A0A8S3UW22_MYTED|nr:CCR7 [Mytilus edulis]
MLSTCTYFFLFAIITCNPCLTREGDSSIKSRIRSLKYKTDMDIRFPLRIIALLVTFHIAVCQDELTDRLGHVSGSEYERVTSHDQTVLWITCGFSVLLIVFLIIFVIVVIKKKMKNKNEMLLLQEKLTEIEGHRLNIEIERLTIEKRRLEIVENKLAFSAA